MVFSTWSVLRCYEQGTRLKLGQLVCEEKTSLEQIAQLEGSRHSVKLEPWSRGIPELCVYMVSKLNIQSETPSRVTHTHDIIYCSAHHITCGCEKWLTVWCGENAFYSSSHNLNYYTIEKISCLWSISYITSGFFQLWCCCLSSVNGCHENGFSS
jgi:hypothetical protein